MSFLHPVILVYVILVPTNTLLCLQYVFHGLQPLYNIFLTYYNHTRFRCMALAVTSSYIPIYSSDIFLNIYRIISLPVPLHPFMLISPPIGNTYFSRNFHVPLMIPLNTHAQIYGLRNNKILFCIRSISILSTII